MFSIRDAMVCLALAATPSAARGRSAPTRAGPSPPIEPLRARHGHGSPARTSSSPRRSPRMRGHDIKPTIDRSLYLRSCAQRGPPPVREGASADEVGLIDKVETTPLEGGFDGVEVIEGEVGDGLEAEPRLVLGPDLDVGPRMICANLRNGVLKPSPSGVLVGRRVGGRAPGSRPLKAVAEAVEGAAGKEAEDRAFQAFFEPGDNLAGGSGPAQRASPPKDRVGALPGGVAAGAAHGRGRWPRPGTARSAPLAQRSDDVGQGLVAPGAEVLPGAGRDELEDRAFGQIRRDVEGEAAVARAGGEGGHVLIVGLLEALAPGERISSTVGLKASPGAGQPARRDRRVRPPRAPPRRARPEHRPADQGGRQEPPRGALTCPDTPCVGS